MEVRAYPAYRRRSACIAACLAIVFCAGAYLYGATERPCAKMLAILLVFVSGSAFVLRAAFGRFFVRCPQCRRRIPLSEARGDGGTQMYECRECGVLWDTRVGVGGD
jgi:hypothetical protein